MFSKFKKLIGIELGKDLEDYTIIGKGVVIEGSISNGKLFIEGTFMPTNGSSFQKLQIAKTGKFISDNESDVFTTEDLEIAGNFIGDVNATNIKILSGATVVGTLSYSGDFMSEINTDINAKIKKIKA